MIDSVLLASNDLLVGALIFGVFGLFAHGVASWRGFFRKSQEIRTNLSLLAVNLLIVSPLILLAGIELGSKATNHGPNDPISMLIIGIVTIMIGDFIGYWRHRIEHSRWLWPSHAVHHSDREMNWLTLLRFHPINRITTSLIDAGLLGLLGLPLWAIILNNFMRHWYGYFIHADLPYTYGSWGRIFVSPAMHRWHHARPIEYAGKNFATVFAFWDRIFGTYYLPGSCTVPTGLDAMPTKGVVAELIYPFKPYSYAKSQELSAGQHKG